MIDTHYRAKLQQILIDPIVAKLKSPPLTPAHITSAALLFGCLSALFTAFHWILPAMTTLALSGLCDVLDGTLARARGTSSPYGAVFDIVSDRLVEGALIFGLYLADPAVRALPSLLMFWSVLICVTSFLVVGIFTKNSSQKSFHYSAGLMERTEAFFFFGAMISLPSYFTLLAYTFVVLVFFTAICRLFEFKLQNDKTQNLPD